MAHPQNFVIVSTNKHKKEVTTTSETRSQKCLVFLEPNYHTVRKAKELCGGEPQLQLNFPST